MARNRNMREEIPANGVECTNCQTFTASGDVCDECEKSYPGVTFVVQKRARGNFVRRIKGS